MTSADSLPLSGRSVDPGLLESLGKQASRLSESSGLSLTQAVVQTIGHTKLNAEQVRRVVEAANVEAWNTKFAQSVGTSRVVHFDAGPADPIQVLQSLQDHARPQEVVVDALDYAMPPSLVKQSSLTGYVDTDRTRDGVLGDVYSLHSKLSAAHEELVQSVEAAKERLVDALSGLVGQIKSASASGATPEEIYACWFQRNPEVAKIAFARTSSFMRPGVKVAGRAISSESKLAWAFDALVCESESLKGCTEALHRVETELAKISGWLQRNGG